eukprot:Gregarina_sp_Poly_1__8708@NODE_51_length_17570_cov_53_504028_g42_i1_p11_GENE_NODE_51_length_17570_cov_53_504028_g42_i1NODE_51_length_17570_cov_53_504028_g42_i1_p11_ORF_typecomplete_len173_score15_78Fer2/PF00111_27/2_7e11MCR/PF18509_1/0_24_NODE_51_length_17570_cov_53_504028_g42_i11302313541
MSLVPRSAGSYFGRGRLPTLFRRPLYPAAPSHFTQTKTFQKFHGSQVDRQNAESFNITFIDKEGKEKPVKAWHGENVLEIAHENEIEVEGACEGNLACSTCHLIIEDPEVYKSFPTPSEREEDMLDCAPGLTDTSRLCCQLVLNADKHRNIKFRLPKNTRNFYVDGFVPKPH